MDKRRHYFLVLVAVVMVIIVSLVQWADKIITE